MNTSRTRILPLLVEYNAWIIFGLMLLLSTFVSDVFFSQTNLSNLFRQVSGVGLISMGMLLVIMVGGIDLSVGSVMSLGGVLLALLTHKMPLGAALTLTIGCGIALGLTAGFLTTACKIVPFIATLALMTIARGISFMISDGSPVPLNSAAAPAELWRWLFSGYSLPGFIFPAAHRAGLYHTALPRYWPHPGRYRQ